MRLRTLRDRMSAGIHLHGPGLTRRIFLIFKLDFLILACRWLRLGMVVMLPRCSKLLAWASRRKRWALTC